MIIQLISLCNVLEHILVIVKNEGGQVRQNAFPIISCRFYRELYQQIQNTVTTATIFTFYNVHLIR